MLKKNVFILASCALVAVLCAIASYSYLYVNQQPSEVPEHKSYSEFIYPDIVENIQEIHPNISRSLAAQEEVTTAETDLIYEYHYTKDGKMESNTEKPPYFLQGLNREGFEKKLSGWDIVEFSKSKVVLSKTINQVAPQNYIVGVQDGYVAIFQKNSEEGNALKERTDIRVNLLPVEEQQRLEAGIPVPDDAQLAKVMEDYGS